MLDYKKLRASDVIGSLISLFDSKDVFIKEFQRVMGERLLKKDFNLDNEVSIAIESLLHVAHDNFRCVFSNYSSFVSEKGLYKHPK